MHADIGRTTGTSGRASWRTRALGLLAAAALVLGTAPGALTPASADEPTYPPSSSTDYIAATFDGITPGAHVFDVVTFERLIKEVLGVDGKSIVLLGSPKNETTTSTLRYVNDVARQWGVQKIYFFDPNLGGELGADITDAANGAPYQGASGLWAAARSFVNTGADNLRGARLKYIDQAYTSASTYLFVYDRKAGGSTIADSAGTVLSDLLVTSPLTALDQSGVSAFETQVAEVFAGAGWTSGNTDENRFDQYHFFKNVWTQSSPAVDAFVPDPTKFTLRSVTVPELLNVLQTPGTHNVFVSGSWCPDSRSLVSYVAENASKANEPVYVFDFRAGSNVTSTYSVLATEATTYTGLGFLGAALVERLAPFNSGTVNVVAQYRPGGDKDAPLATSVNRNFRSPFLAKYRKDATNAKGTAVREWVHQTQDWEAPYKVASGYEAGQVPGAYLDYEVSTGGTNQLQNAKGRASLAEFFDAPGVHTLSGYGPSTSVSTTVNKDDSGCGDDNDPLNDIGEATLIPNQGTDDYDVGDYAIDLTFDPAKIDGPDSITGRTTVSALARKELTRIELDFRAQAIDRAAVTATDVTTGTAVPVTSIEQVNHDEEDLQKLVVYLGSPIASGHAFTLSVPYTTGALDYFVGNGHSPQGFFKTVDGTGLVAIGEPLGAPYWFPGNNTPADGATYTVTLNYPSGYTGISSGTRVSRTNTKTVWRLDQETASYQVFVAIGKGYTQIGGTGTNSLTLSDGRTIPYYDYVNTGIYTANSSRARDKADTFTHELPLYLRALENIAGPYPGDSVGFVFDNVGDGHGTAATFGAVETRDRPFFTSPAITSERTFVHEFAHQWYGDAVRIANWESLWLNEGFATYVTDLYYEQKAAAEQSATGFLANAKYKKVYDNTPATKEWWTYAPANIEQESDLFGGASAAYNRGALALATLRVLVGEEDFATILKQWPQQQKGKAATTADFISFAETTANVELDQWANEWLFGKARPAAWPSGPLPENGTVTPTPEPTQPTPEPTQPTPEPTQPTPEPTQPTNLNPAGTGQQRASIVVPDRAYTGVGVRPAVTVLLGGRKLVAGTDFTVAYKANVKVGTATVTITGRGNYTGTATATFKVVPRTVGLTSVKAGNKKVTARWKKVAGTTKYQLRYRLNGATAWKTLTLAGKTTSKAVTGLKAGKKYTVQVRSYQTVKKVKYYGTWSSTKTVRTVRK